MSLRLNNNIISGAFIAFFALFGLIYLIPNHVQVPKNVEVQALSPDFWPTIIFWLMLILAGGLILEGIKGLSSDTDEGDDVSSTNSSVYEILFWAAIAVIILLSYYYLLEVIGIVASSTITYLALTAIVGEKRLAITIPISLLLPTALYMLFTKVANTPLPLGFFEAFFN